MTTESDDALQALQHEVQRLLGRCLVRIQVCEHLIKAMVAHHEISGPPHALDSILADRVKKTERKTLGTLVGDLLESCIVIDEFDTSQKRTINSDENIFSSRFWIKLNLSDAEFARTVNDLKEFVLLRNNLIHNFIVQHDPRSLEGQIAARDALVVAHNRIGQHLKQLREWSEDMVQSRRLAAEYLRSDEFRDLVIHGIAPDGTIYWPASGIVRALREAAGELALDGWASIAEAGKWIAKRFPEEIPKSYGCSSWRQAVHQSRVFEIRYFEMDGQRSARYREKDKPAKSL